MRILHLLDHSLPVHTGYTFRTASLLREQQKLGWEVIGVTGSKHPEPGPDPETVASLTFRRTPSRWNGVGEWPVLGQFEVVVGLRARGLEIAEAWRPDLVHAHSPALNGLAALHIGRRLGLPVVYECRAFWEDAAVDHGTSTENGLRYRLTRALETRVFKHADAVTCICEGLRSDIVDRGVPAERVTVIPNAVDVDSFAARQDKDHALAESLGLHGPVIGFIGSFYAYEGLPLAIEALAALKDRFPGIKLLLVGGGPEEQRLKGLADASGLADDVVFAGRVPHDQVPVYYELIDVLVYPRMPKRVTELVTPLKPLEAMAQQRLFVASDVGGHRELVRDGETGHLFSAGSAAALTDKLVDVFAQRESWPAIQAAGRRFVEQERTWARSVARYAPVYRRLTGHG